MKIVRVFPRRTSHIPDDDLAFVGDPSFPSRFSIVAQVSN